MQELLIALIALASFPALAQQQGGGSSAPGGGGGVTSVAGANGVTCAPNPVTATGTCSATTADTTKTSSYQAASTDMGGALNLAATSGTPALTLPAESSTIFAPGMTLSIAVTGTVSWTLTNSTGLTLTGLNSTTLLPGTSGTFVANANGTGLDFFSGAQPSGNVPLCDAWITGASTWVTAGSCGTLSSGTWTTPAWVTANTVLTIDEIGAGGGGMWCNTSTAYATPGAAGAELIFSGANVVAASTGYSVAIGTAGSGGIESSSTAPNAGGNTSVGALANSTTYTANGGGVLTTACATTFKNVSAGGTASNGTINSTGKYGLADSTAQLQQGGSTRLGVGGLTLGGTKESDATGYGSGGAGAYSTAANGGAGTQGIIHLTLVGQ